LTKKRLSLDLDLDNYNDKKIWDFLETQQVKSKAIKNILSEKIDSMDLPKKDEKAITIEDEDLKIEDIDPSVLEGF